MEEHLLLRLVGVAVLLAAYIARLISVGSGPIMIFGQSIHPLGLLAVVILLVVAPETVDRLPIGPNRRE